MWLRLSFRFTSLINLICYFSRVAFPLTVRLLLELFRCNSFLSFVTSFLSFQLFPSVRPFLSFQLFPFIRYRLPFDSTLSLHSLLPSFRFNSLLSFVTSFLSFQLFPSVRPFLSFQLFPFIRYRFLSIQLFPCIRYCLPFVSTLSFHSLLPSFRFNSSLPFGLAFRFNSFLDFFLKVVGWSNPDWHAQSKQLISTACHHLLPRPATCSTCGHLLQQAPAFTCTTCGHLRPLEWLQVAASGCKWLPSTCCRDPLRPAATCGHLRPLAPTAPCGHLRPLAPTDHLRPHAATRVAASGCKWLQVAASGCRWPRL